MNSTLVGVFDNTAHVRDALTNLAAAGIHKGSMCVHGADPDDAAVPSPSPSPSAPLRVHIVLVVTLANERRCDEVTRILGHRGAIQIRQRIAPGPGSGLG